MGLSSSLKPNDLSMYDGLDKEIRIIGCAMYNILSSVKRKFLSNLEILKGVNCWDILPGINLALEHDCSVEVDGKRYDGEILFPTQKYKIKVKRNT